MTTKKARKKPIVKKPIEEFKIRLSESTGFDRVRAVDEATARFLYCANRGLSWDYFAHRLEVLSPSSTLKVK